MIDDEIKILLGKIKRDDNLKKIHKNYIFDIKYPKYKKLKENSMINFTSPLTVLTGANGTGKSSILYSLYGCPRNQSTGDYWFNTKVDPLIESNSNKANSYIYSYKDLINDYYVDKEKNVKRLRDLTAIVYKKRSTRPGTKTKKKDLNYWETSVLPVDYRPPDGTERYEPIKKKVLYIDFKGALSAHDKCFYFGSLKNLKSTKIQDYIINKSSKVYNGFRTNSISIDKKIVDKISSILGKSYESASILEHDFYQGMGTSIIFNESEIKYSEAHAGSGEFSVAYMVNKISNAPDHSLILLDEPEVSLHPGSQKLLLKYLLNEIMNKKHQIIISTHSPSLIECLGPDEIKLIRYNQDNKNVEIIENIHYKDAFITLGQSNSKADIYVEDAVAKKFLDEIIKEDNHNIDYIEVKNNNCGAETMKKNIPFYFQSDNIYYCFDGDKKHDYELINISDTNVEVKKISTKECLNYQSKAELETLISELTGMDYKKINFTNLKRSNMTDDEKFALDIKYINYYFKKVFFLPEETPEDMLCKDKIIENYLTGTNFRDLTIVSEILSKNEKSKEKLSEIVSYCHLKDTSVFLDGLIYSFKNLKNDNYEKIKSILDNIYDDFNNQ